MFDLPVHTPSARKDYTQFRDMLLTNGFFKIQFSVYARHAPSEEKAAVFRRRVKANLPPDGEVRILHITDHQFTKMDAFFGKKPATTEKAPEQLTFL